MTTLTIKSRKLETELSFFMRDGGGYIYLEDGDNHGTLGQQICEGGGFSGYTLYASDEEDFKATCRKWYRQYVKSMENYM